MTRTLSRVAVLGLAAAMTGVIAVPQQADAATGATLYVDNSSAACTDSGAGTQAAPFCSIQPAADAANAGDTVLVAGSDLGYYRQNVTIAHSGTATAPITFAVTGYSSFTAISSWTISGSYIVVRGADLGNSAPVTITGSHVTLDGDRVDGDSNTNVVVGPGAVGTTIERSFLISEGDGTLVQIGSGASGTVITTNVLSTDLGSTSKPAISISGASNTEITSNSFADGCSTGVSVVNSTGTSVENNSVSAYSCQVSGQDDLAVDAASAATTTEGYNLLSTLSGGIDPYSWAGKQYTTQSAFAAVSGQGADDLVQSTVDVSTDSIASYSTASASANPSAPGELSTDVYGASWPSNTPDRGAIALKEFTGATLYATDSTPQETDISLDLNGVAWGAAPTVTVDWGDGSAQDSWPIYDYQWTTFSNIPDYHMYAQRGSYTVTVTLTDDAQTLTKTVTVSTNGNTYAPVAPTRVLDTRKGIGAVQAKVAPNGTVPVNVTNGVTLPSGVTAGTITAVVMNVTVADSTAGGNITAYPAGTTMPATSNLNFSAGEIVPNLVTVQVGSGESVDLRNASSGSSDLIADVEGYYVASASGSYYLPNTPQRILDTRKGIGAVEAPVAAGGAVALSVPQCVSGSGSSKVTDTAVAAAVNVTVVSPTSSGYITAYPGQTTAPVSSNLNFSAGETVPNLVVVKVGSDGKIELRNGSPGTVQLVADLEGCYSASLGGAFVPVAPYRALDSRIARGQESESPIAAQPHRNVIWASSDTAPVATSSDAPTAAVMNVTVTQPQAGGDIRAYPSSASLPTASNLNFTAGETVPNLVMVATSGGFGISLYNDSVGKTQLIADVFGYFS